MVRSKHDLLVACLLLLLLIPVSAQASEVTVKFTVQADTFDDTVPPGTTAAGYFSFDSSLIPTGGGEVYNPAGIDLSTFSLYWKGEYFTAPPVVALRLRFDEGGTLTGWCLGVFDDRLFCGYAGGDFVLGGLCSYEICGYGPECIGPVSARYGFDYSPAQSCLEYFPYNGSLTSWSIAPLIHASIDLDPDTVNTSSGGRFITAYIQLPSSYDVTSIDISTVRLNGAIPVPLGRQSAVGDHNGDGIPDFKVKFDRAAFSNLPLGLNEVQLSGRLLAGDPFEGSDVITVNGAH